MGAEIIDGTGTSSKAQVRENALLVQIGAIDTTTGKLTALTSTDGKLNVA